ncbi:HD domain-containing protein [Catellatospora sp. KI3]|uniref:HD domain-containing protein n=1 Tax=Catellatospora sp. KI3 TaxID=3041620 RepID=UPI002482D2BE|nr:HD domain-containing protein [Catellatospora sp. KI3]MDI1464387.1 HD domain-containing protein [Catellatospora sp. KI3]
MEATTPAYLLTMPLHAITEVLGEQGLRDRFALEIHRLPEEDQAVLTDAMELTSRLHEGQRRVREPYLNHVLRVAIRIMCYYHVTDRDVLIAALLHDAVEDQPWRLAGVPDKQGPAPHDAALAEVERRYGARVARLVDAVTNPVYTPDRDHDEQYREHVVESLDAEPWARIIKVSDFTDNGVGIVHTTGPKVMRAAVKYSPLVPLLRELVSRADTPLPGEVKTHIFRQFDLAEQRFRAILGE